MFLKRKNQHFSKRLKSAERFYMIRYLYSNFFEPNLDQISRYRNFSFRNKRLLPATEVITLPVLTHII